MNFIDKAREYIRYELDPSFRKEIETLISSNNETELIERFGSSLEFGTGGLRGIIGGGYNRINPFIIRKTTQGLASYIKKNSTQKMLSAVVAYDSRNYSKQFALQTALTLCANGIKTYLYTSLRSTPQLSFSVRFLKACVGVMITASHNPPQYNGYKVYWDDGAQIVSPHDKGIIAEVAAVVGNNIKFIDEKEALEKGLLHYIDKQVDDQFIKMIKTQTLRKDLLCNHGHKLKVVYTPLHGSGAVAVKRVFTEMGMCLNMVVQQELPDGNFPTVEKPNPEEKAAMKLALKQARLLKADIFMGTDPDADRLGVGVRHKGKYVFLSGNQLGALLADYIFLTRKELRTLPRRAALVKTIVTTELQRLIASDYKVRCYDVLTGFKYIGEKIRQFEALKNGPVYLFGGEESYGYLVETEVRDKDGISAALLTAEMALYWRLSGKTLIDRLKELFLKYGFFEELQITRNFEGINGINVMNRLMDFLRNQTPNKLGNLSITLIKDYQERIIRDIISGKKRKFEELPKSNVLHLILSDGSCVIARPSGTEPKIKFYIMCREKPGFSLPTAQQKVMRKISAIKKDILNIIRKASS